MLYFIIGLVVLAVLAALFMRRGGGEQAGPAQNATPTQDTAPMPTFGEAPQVQADAYAAPTQSTVTQTEVYSAVPQEVTLSPAQARAQAIAEEYRRSGAATDWNPDDEQAPRPEVDAQTLAAARAGVTQDIPDEVLEEMLFQATPQQTAQLFAGVSADVMADLTANTEQGVHYEGQTSDEDLAALSGLGSAVDDLDIWDFGDDSAFGADSTDSGSSIKA